MPPLQITINKPSPPLPTPDPRKGGGGGGRKDDIAILEINGQLFQDWESVQVRCTEEEPPYFTFRFTCSEGLPLVKNFAALRIRPGDLCQVVLAGEPVVYGYVSTRQVFYDAQRHYIEIQGNSHVAGLQHTSVITKTMEFKNVTADQFIRTVLKPFDPKINFVVKNGQLPQTKFPRISIAHGTSVLEAIETVLRSVGRVRLTSNPKGDLVASMGADSGGDVLVEGKNILEGREIIYSEGMANNSIIPGQNWGDDQKNGPVVAHKPTAKQEGVSNLGSKYRPHVMPLDLPAYDDSHLKGRAKMEHDTMANDQVTVFATVQGWQKPSGGLWKPDTKYKVISPMLIMDGSEDLRSRSVTYTQDNQKGTRTMLEMCNDVAMSAHKPRGDDGGEDGAEPSGTGASSTGEIPGSPGLGTP